MVNDAGQAGKYLVAQDALPIFGTIEGSNKNLEAIVNPSSEIAKHKQALREAVNNISDTVSELNGDGDVVLNFDEAGAPANRKSMPVFFARRSSIDPMVKSGLGKSLAEIETLVDKTMKPVVGELKGWRVKGSASLIQAKAKVKNVVGVLEGKGNLKNETVVVGALNVQTPPAH